MRRIAGEVVMLNLLRFREVADSSTAPHRTKMELTDRSGRASR